jgi:CRISPR-associated protein Csm5
MKDGVELPANGPSARREAIVGGQFNALQCELRLALLPGAHAPDKVPHSRVTWPELASACNRYYLPRLRRLLGLLGERKFTDPGWIKGVEKLLDSLAQRFADGQILLLRVGRHSGAENVTLDGVREIRIKQAKGMPARIEDESTTVWLAAENEQGPTGRMLPFGWLLVERDDAPEHEGLRAWCATQPAIDLATIQARLAAGKAASLEDARRLEELTQERQRREQEEAERKQREKEENDRRTPVQREIHAMAEALKRRVQELRGGRERANTQLHTQVRALARKAIAEGWSAQDKAALAAMLSEEVPKAIQVDWKDERKKLQIAQLAGTAP